MLKETSWIKLLLVAAIAALLSGCSSGNSDVSSVDNGHRNYAFGTFSAAGLHGPLAKAALQNCQTCHATPTYGSNPRFSVLRTNIPRGCETCHQYLTAHPTPWLPGRIGTPSFVANATSHATAGNLTTACALCHGAALDGVGGTAPSCMSTSQSGIGCHATSSPVQKPTGCTSCHAGSPGGPGGASWPNRNFGHTKHAAKLNLDCTICHGAPTYGTAKHSNLDTDMAFAATYRANAGIAIAYNKAAGACSAVSCHGGKTTPDWKAPNSIVVDADCLKCHEQGTALGTPQANSYFSGKHKEHLPGGILNVIHVGRLNNAITCTNCHNLVTLAAQHFIGLDTRGYGVNDQPRNTVGGVATRITSYNNNNTCTTSCHTSGGEGAW